MAENKEYEPEMNDGGKWMVVATADNDIEFSMLKGIIQMGNIPVVRKVQGVDGLIEVLIGTPIVGIDLLVPEDRYEEAYALINSSIVDEDFFEEDK